MYHLTMHRWTMPFAFAWWSTLCRFIQNTFLGGVFSSLRFTFVTFMHVIVEGVFGHSAVLWPSIPLHESTILCCCFNPFHR